MRELRHTARRVYLAEIERYYSYCRLSVESPLPGWRAFWTGMAWRQLGHLRRARTTYVYLRIV